MVSNLSDENFRLQCERWPFREGAQAGGEGGTLGAGERGAGAPLSSPRGASDASLNGSFYSVRDSEAPREWDPASTPRTSGARTSGAVFETPQRLGPSMHYAGDDEADGEEISDPAASLVG